MRCRRLLLSVLLGGFLSAVTGLAGEAGVRLPLLTNDVIAFLGGANLVATDHSGHLETLLLRAHPRHRLRFRSLAWEGDTVFAQPREVNFPAPTTQLAQLPAAVVFLQFGQMESLAGPTNLPAFVAAYERLLDGVTAVTPRVVLVTPTPFGPTPAVAGPDAAERNASLARYVAAIRELGSRRGLPVVDVFTPLVDASSGLTDDGVQLTASGQDALSRQVVAGLGLVVPVPGTDAGGAYATAELEALRQAVVAKNRLWFNSWRPTNWAFLAGDRVDQPFSRDYRDLKVRAFAEEMKQFAPLLAEADREVAARTEAASRGLE